MWQDSNCGPKNCFIILKVYKCNAMRVVKRWGNWIRMGREMEEEERLQEAKKKAGILRARRVRLLLLVLFLSFPLLYILCKSEWNPSPLWFQDIREKTGSEDDFSIPFYNSSRDKLLGGLLLPGFDEKSCHSRYQSVYYRKESPFLPSSYLVSRLRQYESLHKKCGPDTPLYKKSIKQLKNSKHSASNLECNYVVWTPINGLGNRMITIASAFLYALLTNKVLLVHLPRELVDLFCEPFPNTSWVLPSDFPLIDILGPLHQGSPVSYGSMLENRVIDNSLNSSAEMLPSYVYVHLKNDYKHYDGLFFCEDDQLLFDKVNWIVLKSDIYFVPQLFLIEQYRDELERLFPAKETVFHHLGRYLFHPTNSVWRMVTRFYHSHLAQAEEKTALQIRYMPKTAKLFENLFQQVMSCSLREKILPKIDTTKEQFATPRAANGKKVKVILVISMYAKYSEKIKSMYYSHPTTTGEEIRIYQPTHEERQNSRQQSHNQKAVADMYLLSMCDVLLTSPWSTFGYIGQSLAGVKPWILFNQDLGKVADPPCVRAMSMEPCFHNPSYFDCKARKAVDSGAVVKYVRHCEEAHRGVKLVDD